MFQNGSSLTFTVSKSRYLIKPVTTIALIVAGIIGYSLLRKAGGLNSLNFYPDGVKDLHFESDNPIITFGIAVQNTSNQQYTFTSLAGNLYSNGYFVGTVSNFTPVVSLPNTQVTIPITVRLQLIEAANQLVKAFTTRNNGMNVELQAQLNVDGIQFPYTFKFKVG